MLISMLKIFNGGIKTIIEKNQRMTMTLKNFAVIHFHIFIKLSHFVYYAKKCTDKTKVFL